MALDLSSHTPPPAKPARKTPARKTTPKKPTEELRAERVDGVSGWFQIAGGLCVATGNMPDGVAVAKFGPQISQEMVKIADTDPRMAKIVDFLASSGPYAGLVSAVVLLGLQLGVNHKKIPLEAVAAMGVVAPEQLINEAVAEATEMQAKQAERAAEAEQRKVDAENRLKAVQGDGNGD